MHSYDFMSLFDKIDYNVEGLEYHLSQTENILQELSSFYDVGNIKEMYFISKYFQRKIQINFQNQFEYILSNFFSQKLNESQSFYLYKLIKLDIKQMNLEKKYEFQEEIKFKDQVISLYNDLQKFLDYNNDDRIFETAFNEFLRAIRNQPSQCLYFSLNKLFPEKKQENTVKLIIFLTCEYYKNKVFGLETFQIIKQEITLRLVQISKQLLQKENDSALLLWSMNEIFDFLVSLETQESILDIIKYLGNYFMRHTEIFKEKIFLWLIDKILNYLNNKSTMEGRAIIFEYVNISQLIINLIYQQEIEQLPSAFEFLILNKKQININQQCKFLIPYEVLFKHRDILIQSGIEDETVKNCLNQSLDIHTFLDFYYLQEKSNDELDGSLIFLLYFSNIIPFHYEETDDIDFSGLPYLLNFKTFISMEDVFSKKLQQDHPNSMYTILYHFNDYNSEKFLFFIQQFLEQWGENLNIISNNYANNMKDQDYFYKHNANEFAMFAECIHLAFFILLGSYQNMFPLYCISCGHRFLNIHSDELFYKCSCCKKENKAYTYVNFQNSRKCQFRSFYKKFVSKLNSQIEIIDKIFVRLFVQQIIYDLERVYEDNF